MNEKIVISIFKSNFGELILGSFQNQLCICDWKYRKMRTEIDKRIKTNLNSDFIVADSEIINKTQNQLVEYFNGSRKVFTIPLLLIGTDFQKKVWNELLQIPYGTTLSYLKLSQKTGDSKAVRAVANANGSNAISIIVPCHRIIGSNGKMVGYAGGISIKEKLLSLEMNSQNEQLKLF
jgi:methylated-DNA-[protein]-cysteine S-methyltransferase